MFFVSFYGGVGIDSTGKFCAKNLVCSVDNPELCLNCTGIRLTNNRITSFLTGFFGAVKRSGSPTALAAALSFVRRSMIMLIASSAFLSKVVVSLLVRFTQKI